MVLNLWGETTVAGKPLKLFPLTKIIHQKQHSSRGDWPRAAPPIKMKERAGRGAYQRMPIPLDHIWFLHQPDASWQKPSRQLYTHNQGMAPGVITASPEKVSRCSRQSVIWQMALLYPCPRPFTVLSQGITFPPSGCDQG